ncbi:MAG: FMN-dependent NADH-azoreductase [Thermaurantiacus sp.]
MRRLLHLNASPRGRRSRSLAVAKALVDRMSAGIPGLATHRIDLFEAPLPRFDGTAVEGRYRLLHGQAPAPEEEAAWKAMREMAQNALAHDIWLINTPMWNFGLPFPLKQWIDSVTHPGLLFEVSADGSVRGLAGGQRLILVAASAMPFALDPALADLDFQLAYLNAWAGFIGITSLEAIRIAPTYGPDEVVASVMARGHADASALAERLMQQARADAPD